MHSEEPKYDGEQEVAGSPETITSSQDTSDSVTPAKLPADGQTYETSTAPSHADPSVGTEKTPDVQREKATEDTNSVL